MGLTDCGRALRLSWTQRRLKLAARASFPAALTRPDLSVDSARKIDFRRGTLARVTVEDCLENVHNRFALVILAAERARQLANGAKSLVRCDNKPAVTSLREIAKKR